MFNSSNYGITGTRLHRRGIQNAIKNTKPSFVENLELQRSLSFASPGGFLFRLNKDDGVKSLTQGNPAKITLQGKRICSGKNEGKFFRSTVGQDVSSILRQSILQRSKLALRSASNFKDLRIDGETTYLLKAEKNPQNHCMNKSPVSLGSRKGNVDVFPPLAKYRAHDKSQKQKRTSTESQDTSLSLDGNQILPAAKQDVSVENKMENKVFRRAHRVADKTKYNRNGFMCLGSEESISDRRTQSKRIITVFLPVISTDEQ